MKALGMGVALCALVVGTQVAAQEAPVLTEREIYAADGAEIFVFSNWYDGLFADSKISGVEIVQRGTRTATNGDVRLSATPGQWDPIGQLVERTVDPATQTVLVTARYAEYDFDYRIRAVPAGEGVRVTVELDEPLPAALAGRAGFNLEFVPSAYWGKALMADGRATTFPRYPAAEMSAGGERNAASGRDIGPGAEVLPFAQGQQLVLAPADAARRVAVTSANGRIGIHDGRNQAQNGWFVLRETIPAGASGTVIDWLIEPQAESGWTRAPVIGHSQVGYAPAQAKRAIIELDGKTSPAGTATLNRIAADGTRSVAKSASVTDGGDYLRFNYAIFDFTDVTAEGLYEIAYAGQTTAPFRIARDVYASAWHPTNDVFMPVQMDHMFVNEAYRVWHGDPHRDDALQAPVNHEHIDLYRQGPTTDTAFAPGEHIPGLAVGGWLDAGDFDIRTQTQYGTIRGLVQGVEAFGLSRDTVLVDHAIRRAELHVPDGKSDHLQQIHHGILQLMAQFDAVGHAIHGIVEPDVQQYTHLGDAVTKTDGLVYDASLEPFEVAGGRSGTPDDRWAFTSRSSSLDYGSIAALAAASRVLGEYDPDLAARAHAMALAEWAEEQTHEPYTFSHGNTTGGPLEIEKFTAAVELLKATGEARFQTEVREAWPEVAERFAWVAETALSAIPFMDEAYSSELRAAAAAYVAQDEATNPYGVPITEGGWAGSGTVMRYGLTHYAIHRAFPEISDGSAVFRALDFMHGTHPGHNLSLVSGVGAESKEVAYGMNRADWSFIAGGPVPGILILKPDLPENREDWPFMWGQNEYVVPQGPTYMNLVQAGRVLAGELTPPD